MGKLLILYSILLIGCTSGAEVEMKNKISVCKDSRDGETFSFNQKTITNVRMGFLGADSCFDVIDGSGKKRTLCKSHEVFLKCGGKKSEGINERGV